MARVHLGGLCYITALTVVVSYVMFDKLMENYVCRACNRAEHTHHSLEKELEFFLLLVVFLCSLQLLLDDLEGNNTLATLAVVTSS